MTDRAEPGVTPLDALPRLQLSGADLDRIGAQSFFVDFDEYDEFVRLDDVRATLDAATPRPGLVERIEKFASLHRLQWSDDVIADLAAFLASGTGEPELDVERLARSLRALEARDELTVADGFLGGRDHGDYVTFATSIAAAYANDKGADPTPEPK